MRAVLWAIIASFIVAGAVALAIALGDIPPLPGSPLDKAHHRAPHVHHRPSKGLLA